MGQRCNQGFVKECNFADPYVGDIIYIRILILNVKKLSDIPNIDKPREKLASRGVKALSSHELILI